MQTPVSPYEDYCVGYQNPGVIGRGYLMALVIGVGKVKERWSHAGSQVLDKTLAFDTAEVSSASLGQINMITVSSFCGPEGRIWGLDLARPANLRESVLNQISKTPVYDASPLLESAKALFGTVEDPKYLFLPGSHVPCASKSVAERGECQLYAGIGVGVPVDRGKNACLMMEDVGELGTLEPFEVKTRIAESIVEVGINQRVKYKEIFVGVSTIEVGLAEVGCALVAAPYFAPPANALKMR